MKTKHIIPLLILMALAACKGSKLAEDHKADKQTTANVANSTEKKQIATTGQTGNEGSYSVTYNTLKKEPVSFKRDSSNKAIRAYFANGKYFDLYENNPYEKQSFPTLGKDMGFNVYDVKGKTLKEVLPNVNKKYLDTSVINPNSHMNTLSSYGSIFIIGDSLYLIAVYRLIAKDKNINWAANTTILVMDMQGNIIKKLNNLSLGAQDIWVTNDLKYLCFLYGLGGAFEGPDKGGFVIYNLADLTVFYENRNSYNGLFLENNKLYVTTKFNYNERYETREMYDLTTLKRYYRKFTYEESSNIISADENGYTIRIENENFRTYLFDKDFTMEDLK